MVNKAKNDSTATCFSRFKQSVTARYAYQGMGPSMKINAYIDPCVEDTWRYASHLSDDQAFTACSVLQFVFWGFPTRVLSFVASMALAVLSLSLTAVNALTFGLFGGVIGVGVDVKRAVEDSCCAPKVSV